MYVNIKCSFHDYFDCSYKVTDDFGMKHAPSMKTCESRGWVGEMVCHVVDGLSMDKSVATTLDQLKGRDKFRA